MATNSSILPGKFCEQRSLVGYSTWVHKESDMTEHSVKGKTMVYFWSLSKCVYNGEGSKIFCVSGSKKEFKFNWSGRWWMKTGAWNCESENSSMSHSLGSHGLYPARILCPWNSPGKNTGGSFHFLFQGIFPSQGSNLSLLHCRQILYRQIGVGE